MKNLILTAVISLLSFQALASRDSVAFFYKPNKVVVLINERIEAGKRLQDFMDHFGSDQNLSTSSEDEAITIKCARNATEASCTFTFLPGNEVRIQDRALNVTTSVQSLKLNNNGAFNMAFASSMKDIFTFQVSEKGEVKIEGSKRIGQ